MGIEPMYRASQTRAPHRVVPAQTLGNERRKWRCGASTARDNRSSRPIAVANRGVQLRFMLDTVAPVGG